MSVETSRPHPPATSVLPCPLPMPWPAEPAELTAFRAQATDTTKFNRLRRSFQGSENWRALATLLVLHAAALDPDKAEPKVVELCLKAADLWSEKADDLRQCAYALARALQARPDDPQIFERLCTTYHSIGAHRELISVHRWRYDRANGTASAAAMAVALGLALEQELHAPSEALPHYEAALSLVPATATAADRLIAIALDAGAWEQAVVHLNREVARAAGASEHARAVACHRQLAHLEARAFDNVAQAARHLHAALRLVPDDADALQDFGELYLHSGKHRDEVAGKAADVFYKAAELARRHDDPLRASRLLFRALDLVPEHAAARRSIEQVLSEGERWFELDELYRSWISNSGQRESVPLLLRRADLLKTRFDRLHEARELYEEASRFQPPTGESWHHLEQIYSNARDYDALIGILDTEIERLGHQAPIATLLRAAQIARDELGDEERAAIYFYKVLEREAFNAVAFEGYKEHWRRKHHWTHLCELILYQIEQAAERETELSASERGSFSAEFAELAEIYERRLGDIDGALDTWKRFQAAYPQDPRPAEHIARIEKRARMWDNMVRVQEAELERTADPQRRLDILRRLGSIYRDRQVNPQRAIELQYEILSLSPNDVQATRALIALYDRARDFPRVVAMISEQLDASDSLSERLALLRRLADIWHNELQDLERARWACERILDLAPEDPEALTRLQRLLEAQDLYGDLFELLARDETRAPSTATRLKLLRRMAYIAEYRLDDGDRATQLWTQIAELDPGDAETRDRLIALHIAADRPEQAASLLRESLSDPATSTTRKLSDWQRIVDISETTTFDPDLPHQALDEIRRLAPYHRGTLEALVKLYRERGQWQELNDALAQLYDLVDDADTQTLLAYERVSILEDRLHDPAGAEQVLASVPHVTDRGATTTRARRLSLCEQAKQPEGCIALTELALVAEANPQARRRLYDGIVRIWTEDLGDVDGALATLTRCVSEFPSDASALARLAALQTNAGEYEPALTTLRRLVEASPQPGDQVAVLQQMAELSARSLYKPTRALEFLREAGTLDGFSEALLGQLRALARDHNLWRDLVPIFTQRFDNAKLNGDGAAQVSVAREASETAWEQLHDADLALAWGRRAYFTAIEHRLDTGAAADHLRSIAADAGRWRDWIDVLQHEIPIREDRNEHELARACAKEIAEVWRTKCVDEQQYVETLARAHRMDPRDEEVARALERESERLERWDLLADMWKTRLERSDTPHERHGSLHMLANVYDRHLREPDTALRWLIRGWFEFHIDQPSLADELFAEISDLIEHHGLWQAGAHFHLTRAQAAGDGEEHFAALRHAADIFENHLDDPRCALRCLLYGLAKAVGLADEHWAAVTRVAELVDADARTSASHSGDASMKVGTLAVLQLLRTWTRESTDNGDKARWLREAADLREHRLGDPTGAALEWLRVHVVDPTNTEALAEVERLCEQGERWDVMLVVLARQLEIPPTVAHARATWQRIAQVFEYRLGNPEYALRARVQGWQLAPAFPDQGSALDDEHGDLWRLAEITGSYRTPPIPKDPVLQPRLVGPETGDADLWQRAGLGPEWIDTPPDGPLPTATRQDHAAATGNDETIFNSPVPVAQTVTSKTVIGLPPEEALEDELDDELEVVELVDVGIEELDLDDISEIDAGPQPPDLPGTGPGTGLPPLPQLRGPLLPPRPRVASAWEEVALAYRDAAHSLKTGPDQLALFLAGMWEQGAGNLESAFQVLESAVASAEDPSVLQAELEALALRHDVPQRLLAAYETLVEDATSTAASVEYGLQLARLLEEHGDTAAAQDRYQDILGMEPGNEVATEALLRLYSAAHEYGPWATLLARKLDHRDALANEDETIGQTLQLCSLWVAHLNRLRDAGDRLEALVREFPHRPEPHEALIQLRLSTEQWLPAIEAMRTAGELLGDAAQYHRQLQRIANIYEHKLDLPERAIATWVERLELGPDAEALTQLQRLYTAGGRHAEALSIIETRLAQCEQPPAGPRRIELLLAKARALQEGDLDPAAALLTLESLRELDPAHPEVALRLAQLQGQTGAHAAAIATVREQLARTGDSAEAALPLLTTMVELSENVANGPLMVLEQIHAARHRYGDIPELLQLQTSVARKAGDAASLVDALAMLPNSAGRIEAALLCHRALQQSQRAQTLLREVLSAARGQIDDLSASHVAAAIDGLVSIYIDLGAADQARTFLESHLAEAERADLRAQLHTLLGRLAYDHRSDLETARSHFTAAIEAAPDGAGPKLALGEVLADAGQPSEAQTTLEQACDALALAGDPARLAHGLAVLARVLRDQGRHADAHRRLAQAVRHAPDNLALRLDLIASRLEQGRHREALAAADQLEAHLETVDDLTSTQRKIVSQALVLGAHAAEQLRQPVEGITRYARAFELDPHNADASDPLIAAYKERGQWARAARATLVVAHTQQLDPAERANHLVSGALLAFRAAGAMVSSEPSPPENDQAELQKTACHAVCEALDILETAPNVTADIGHLQAIFYACGDAAPKLALRCLAYLLGLPLLEARVRQQLVLDGVDMALDQPNLLTEARRLVEFARELDPSSPLTMLAHLHAHEVDTSSFNGLADTLSAFLRETPPGDEDKANRAARVTLWTRLSELRADAPSEAIAALGEVLRLDRHALSLGQRRRLAALYRQGNIENDDAAANQAEILACDPCDEASLLALAEHHHHGGRLHQAWAVYKLLALVAPGRPQSSDFFAQVTELQNSSASLVLEGLTPPPIPDANISAALQTFAGGATSIVAEHFPRADKSESSPISGMDPGAIAQTWTSIRRLFASEDVSLIRSGDHTATERTSHAVQAWFEVRFGQIPVLVAHRTALDSHDTPMIRFAMSAALYYCRRENLFAMGLPRPTFALWLSALLEAFDPQHLRRKYHQDADDPTLALSQELTRKVPIRVARQITQLLRAGQDEPFASHEWKARIRRAGHRVGLALCGDLSAAIRVLTATPGTPTGDALRDFSASNEDLRALLAFATTDSYVRAREQLGWEVQRLLP